MLGLTKKNDSAYREAIYSIRSAIFWAREKKCRSFMIASAWPREGRTTTLLNLCDSLCEILTSVTLVDGDLRNRKLTRLMQGFNPRPNLTFIPAYEMEDKKLGLLKANAVEDIAQTWKGNNSIVLVDTPAMSHNSDALLWAKSCDATIFIVSQSKFSGVPEGNFVQNLWDAGTTVLGGITLPT